MAKSVKPGENISTAEIQNVSQFGIWMIIKGREYFLSYREFPWFEKATIKMIYNFEFLHDRHLFWPDLDIDLSLDVLAAPQNFPLKARR